jgi:signal transduction histidine kinase
LSWLFRLRGERPAPQEAIIISLDRESGDALHLPDNLSNWPRSLHARFVSKLSEQKPAVIAFDVSFREPSDEDPLFAGAIRAAGNVVLAEWIDLRQLPQTPLGDPAIDSVQIQQVISPVPLLAKEAAALATFPLPKIPVRVSQYWQLKDGNPGFPTLPVVAFQIFTKKNRKTDAFAALPGLDKNGGSAYLNFYGPPQTITTVPYHKVLQLPDPITVNGRTVSFSGKAVFVGSSEKTPVRQRDGFYTVFSRPDGLDISGVEIAATAFSNLLENSAINPLPVWGWLLTLLIWGMFIGIACSLLPLAPAMGLGFLLPLLYLEGALLQFSLSDRWLPLVIPIGFQTPLALFGVALSHYFRAREMDRLKSEAVQHLAHEIRTPLASTKGYLDNMRDRIVGDLTEKQQNYIGRMTMNMDRLNRMVQDHLNLSQIESGKMRLSLAPLSLEELLSERIEGLKPIFARKEITVSLHPSGGDDRVLADRDRIDQVFTNLLDNAIKFTPSGGEIIVTCRRQSRWIETSIRDTGIGIPLKEQAKIFNRLHQVQSGQPSRGKGAGLGLFIVKQLVELHGGTVRVKSCPGQGSEFIVTLPAPPDGEEEPSTKVDGLRDDA